MKAALLLPLLLAASAFAQDVDDDDAPKHLFMAVIRQCKLGNEKAQHCYHLRKVWYSAPTSSLRIEQYDPSERYLMETRLYRNSDSYVKAGDVCRHTIGAGEPSRPRIFEEKEGTPLAELYFGSERTFFKAHGAKRLKDRLFEGRKTEFYELTLEDWDLKLWIDAGVNRPRRLEVHMINGNFSFFYKKFSTRAISDSFFAPYENCVDEEYRP